MAKSKKIKLQKRSAASARLQKGLSLPAGAGGDGYLGFRDMADLKCKYFVRTGNLARLPFALRMLVLFFAQFIFTFVLYSRMAEGILLNRPFVAAFFGILLILFPIPTVMSQISLGVRRCHDIGRSGVFFAFPFICYCSGFILPILGMAQAANFAQLAALITYAGLTFMKGKRNGKTTS